MIKNNKKFFAVYAVWVALHLYLFLSAGAPKYLDKEDYFQFLTDAKKNFYPLPLTVTDEYYRKINDWFIHKNYDSTELFVYSVAPLLLLFLFKAFTEKEK